MNSETRNWTLHIAAAAVILICLGLHMAIMHLDRIAGFFLPAGGVALDWENVLARSKSAAFVLIYTALLGAALYHGLYGLRSILFEAIGNKTVQKAVGALVTVLGVILFLMATAATVTVKLINP